jgi:hypothetical protein
MKPTNKTAIRQAITTIELISNFDDFVISVFE